MTYMRMAHQEQEAVKTSGRSAINDMLGSMACTPRIARDYNRERIRGLRQDARQGHASGVDMLRHLREAGAADLPGNDLGILAAALGRILNNLQNAWMQELIAHGTYRGHGEIASPEELFLSIQGAANGTRDGKALAERIK